MISDIIDHIGFADLIGLIGLAAFGLAAFAYYLRRRGFGLVLIKEVERPERIMGCEVRALIPSLRRRAGGLSPIGKVVEHEAGWYLVVFCSPWTTEYGNLSSIRVRSAVAGNPVSRASSRLASRIPAIVKFSDGREVQWELVGVVEA
jgi:hypothetical protein